MRNDSNSSPSQATRAEVSTARRREVLRRIGQTTLVAGVASPAAALASGGRAWCRHPVDTNRCVQASISGMGSTMLSAQASDELCAYKVSHYSDKSRWPSTCTGASGTISGDTRFKYAFGCSDGALDSQGRSTSDDSGCLLNKKLADLCKDYPSSPEAHWACALANANKLSAPATGAPFPYTPQQVAGYYLSSDLIQKNAAYTFFSQYCEQYS